ncbi:BTAD domain-containing putative transcriptional regulator [Naasia sp. SYSU D00948]|uniref:BTAD domain-containing putative transcriptional regulator n=1 Tax=Naasia sp. SYSU D00948 TaxID=2817379 RepID=UPI001B30E006|nr:BTAD domain-containing putative transcriptional regulator [Naasia sp. SYSU D00948]
MHYRLLGSLEVEHDDARVDLGPPKQRAVLAVLLLSRGRVVPTDRLVAAVWGENPPTSVSASLQAYISNLRRILRDERTAASPIVRRSPGYLLDIPDEHVDVAAFLRGADAARAAVEARDWPAAVDAARTALEFWRGGLLEDLRDEEWVKRESHRLDERRSETRENLVTGLLGCGRLAEAVVEAQRLRSAEPLRERGAWLEVIALHRDGRSADALDAYRAHARLLDEELGLEPGPALRDLHGAILRQDPDLATWPVASRARHVPAVVEPDRPHEDPEPADAVRLPSRPFIGRTRELAAIRGMRTDAGTDTARWLVLTGPAGIGKTRLAEETLADEQSRGARIVRTACPEDEGTPPWWPIRGVVRGLGGDPDVLLTPPAGTDADAARWVVYDRLDGLLRASVTGETVILVDDVQWSDSASLRWLTHLASSGFSGRITFVLTVRDEGEPRPDLERLLAAIARQPANRQLAVSPLATGEVAELAALVSGEEIPDEEAVALTEQTGGNPFFVGEYARLPREERAAGGIPLAVRSVLRRRLTAVDPDVLQVLRTAAVMNDPLDIDLLCAVTRLDREELADLLDEAADEHLIVPAPESGSYAFAHGLLRDEVLAGLSAPRRQRLHAKIAEALRSSGGPDRLVRRAAHLVSAFPLVEAEEVFEACRAAALDAEERWLSEAAARWYDAAIRAYDQLPDERRDDEERDQLLVARVAALARAGRWSTVLQVVEEGVTSAVRDGRLPSAGRLAATLLRTAGSWPWAAYTEDAAPLMARLVGIEPLVAADPAAHARVLAAIAVGSYYEIDGSIRDRLSARAIELAESTGDNDVLADTLLGRALVFAGVASHVHDEEDALKRLLVLPHRLARLDTVLSHNMLTLTALIQGRLDEMEEHLRQGIAGSDSLRLPISRVQLRWAEGTFHLFRGDIERAEQLYRHAYELHRQTELYVMGVHELALLAVRWHQGRLSEVEGVPVANVSMMPWAQAALAIAAGRTDEGEAMIAAALRKPTLDVWTTGGELTLLAHQMADAGLGKHAAAVAERLRPLAGLVGAIGQVGVIGRVDDALRRLNALDAPEAAQGPADAHAGFEAPLVN